MCVFVDYVGGGSCDEAGAGSSSMRMLFWPLGGKRVQLFRILQHHKPSGGVLTSFKVIIFWSAQLITMEMSSICNLCGQLAPHKFVQRKSDVA